MRIQTRLFLGTATLVLALMAVQWWLHARQLRAIERDLGRVATSVGKGILGADMQFIRSDIESFVRTVPKQIQIVGDEDDQIIRKEYKGDEDTHVQVVVLPESEIPHRVQSDGHAPNPRSSPGNEPRLVEERIEWIVETDEDLEAEHGEPFDERHIHRAKVSTDGRVRRLMLQVEGSGVRGESYLVVSEDEHPLHRIPIPVSSTIETVQSTMREGAGVSGVLLVAGLVASGILSRRLTRPLRTLVDGAEAVGRGDLGVQVPVSATGEIGDLQRAFNHMSERLTVLEKERESWQQREHLAQLGDLSRGLAHTLRNPLHTLGLAVDELADGEPSGENLAITARSQIRRIDRWLRSFLALGAEDAAEPVPTDLRDVVQTVALESIQQGAEVLLEGSDQDLTVRVVPGAIRAAIANLVENAIDASPEGEAVLIRIVHDGGDAVVRIIDRGSGIPQEVLERLFSPHVTTKEGGSGMGLFLARQLVVGMHGGRLEVENGEDGGTIVTVGLPLNSDSGEDGNTVNG